MPDQMTDRPIVLVGGLGKTGARIRDRLAARGIATRAASRGTAPAFDWSDRASWAPALAGARAAYVAYQPDLAVPRAPDDIAAFAAAAEAAGIGHVVLLSGRGEDSAVLAEARLRAGPVPHTILRSAWFAENFSEGAFRDGILAGTLALPAGATPEPFVSVDDLADVAVLALTDPAHRGRTYDLTGPRLLTFAEAVAAIAAATGRAVRYETVPIDGFIAELRGYGLDAETLWLMRELFENTLDGRNASLSPDLPHLLGRPARDLADVVADAARAGSWEAVDA